MAYKWKVILCLFPGLTVFLLDATIVNVALAKLGAVFGVDVATVQWSITAFALASGIATPMTSFVEARFTMKRVWVTALAVFTAASVLCGLAPVFSVLVVGRVLQGIAGGMMMPMAISTLFRSFPPQERGMALGLFAIPIVAGPALGPTIGGYIVTYMDWRLVFFVNLPIGIGAVLLSMFLLHPGEPNLNAKFDTVGAVLSTIAFGSILYGLSKVSEDGWDSLTVRGLVGLGLATLLIFVVFEWTQDQPILDVRLFARWQFLVANVVGWVSTIALFGAEFMLPLYLQNLRGLTAVDTGLLLLPQGLSVAVAGPIGGRLVDKIGPRMVVIVGFCLLAFNTWQLSFITMDTTYSELRWLLIVRGLALGCTMQPTQLVAMGVVPERLRTNASSLNSAMRNVFQSFGIAMLSTVVQTQQVVHAAQLGWQVRPDTFQGATLADLAGVLQAQAGLAPPAASLAAVSVVVGQIAQQSAVLAFGDAYRITFFAALASIAAAFMLPGRGVIRADPGAAAAH